MYTSGRAAVRVSIQAGPIATNPRSTETCEYGLTHGTCFVERRLERLEVVAVAQLVWISFSFSFFYLERTRPAASKRPPCLIYVYTRNEAVFFPVRQKRLFIPGCVQGAIIQLVRVRVRVRVWVWVCLCVCHIRVSYWFAKYIRGRFP